MKEKKRKLLSPTLIFKTAESDAFIRATLQNTEKELHLGEKTLMVKQLN